MNVPNPSASAPRSPAQPLRSRRAAELELLALLRKCHREELLPLAELLKVDPELGLSDLSREIESRLRRAGGQALLNLARGEGPPYEQIARDVARRLGVDGAGPIERVEGRVVRAWLERCWNELPEADRQALWSEFGLPDQPAPDGATVSALAEQQLGARFPLLSSATAALTLGSAGLSLLILRPLAPFIAASWLARQLGPEEEKILPGVVQVATLRQQVLHRVTIGLVGSPSSGKDAAMKALFGVETGNIHPIPGATREVGVFQVPDAAALFLVNTPGMGDVVESLTEAARQVMDHIDVYLYVLNAQGGVQARELRDYQACVDSGKPTLVCLNKIDAIRPRERARYIQDAREKLGGAGVELVPCAFDPLPPISERPINTDQVRGWLLLKLVSLGKDTAGLPSGEAPTRWSMEPPSE